MAGSTDLMIINLAEAMGRTSTTDGAITVFVRHAAAAVGTEFACLTMLREGGRFVTRGATHHVVEEADRLQYELDQGPCVDAATESRSLTSASLATDDRWPIWGPAVGQLGMQSILSVDLHGRGQRIGALNLYGIDERDFAIKDLDRARVFASIGGAMLGFATNADGLKKAIDHRTVIGQAQGIIMEKYDIDAAAAFSLLRRHSQQTNVRLHEVAEHIVDLRGEWTP